MPRVNFGSFSLDVSPEWTLSTLILTRRAAEQAADPSLRSPRAPQRFQQNLVATMEPVGEEETPESYVQKQRAGLLGAQVQYREATPPETVTLADGRKGVLTEQVIIGSGGSWVRQMQLVTIKDGIAHTLICSQLDGESFLYAREHLRAMLLSLQ